MPENQSNCILFVTRMLGTDSSSFNYSDINLYLIYYACCKLWYCCSSSKATPGFIFMRLHTRGIALLQLLLKKRQDNLKRKIKNQILYTCWLFLLIRVFQDISNWQKVFQHLPTLFLQQSIPRVIIFPNYAGSWLCSFIYKFG